MPLAVHLHDRRRIQAEMADGSVFVARGKLRQPIPVEEPACFLRIHSEIAHVVRNQILKEMRALGRRYPEVTEPCLDDDPCARRPLGSTLPGCRDKARAIPSGPRR